MFAAYLKDVAVWKPVLRHSVFRESLAWLGRHAATADFGDHSLGAMNWFANVHEYPTLAEAECVWENHKHTIDIQYLLRGNEGVRWASIGQFGLQKSYIENNDRQEFNAPSGCSSLINFCPGMFIVFLPGDVHCPKISLSKPEILRKVVVKIPIQLLEDRNLDFHVSGTYI